MNIANIIKQASTFVYSWPFLLGIIGVSILCTIACNFIQFRYFFYAWKISLFPKKESDATSAGKKVDMSPIQALVNALSASLGNGSIAGMATAIYSGGPGAALWVVIFGLIVMAVRFAEVFLSTHFGARSAQVQTALGGPMLYLRNLPGGHFLSYIYAALCLFFGFVIGNAMQANSICISLATTLNVQPHNLELFSFITAGVLLLFTVYVTTGGAQKVVALSNKIVPLKVATFFISAFIVLTYHYQALGGALALICKSAFSPVAAVGGVLGFSVQQAVRFGMARSVMATESGLGTAAILFGFTGSSKAVEDGIMATLSTFISTVVCFLISLCIVASGVWDTGLTSTALTIAAYGTVFGSFGGWVVTFLSITFGIGVLVTFAYVARECWLFLTGGRFGFVFSMLYCCVTFLGAIIKANVIFDAGDIVLASMLFINLLGVVWLLPVIRKGVVAFMAKQQ